MRRTRSVTTLVMLLAAVAACGGGADSRDAADGESAAAPSAASSAAPATGSAADPCSVMTSEEMATAIGTAVTAVERAAPTRCVYRTANPVVYVELEVDRETADASWQGVNAGNAVIDAPQDTIAGLGADAFFGPRDRLYVRSGTTFLSVEAGFDDQVRDRARRVAVAVLGKLP